MTNDLQVQNLRDRDIAVRADAKVDSHIQDCVAQRVRLASDMKDLKSDLSAMKLESKEDIADLKVDTRSEISAVRIDILAMKTDTRSEINEVRSDLKKQSWIIASATGGLLALSKFADFLVPLIHH